MLCSFFSFFLLATPPAQAAAAFLLLFLLLLLTLKQCGSKMDFGFPLGFPSKAQERKEKASRSAIELPATSRLFFRAGLSHFFFLFWSGGGSFNIRQRGCHGSPSTPPSKNPQSYAPVAPSRRVGESAAPSRRAAEPARTKLANAMSRIKAMNRLRQAAAEIREEARKLELEAGDPSGDPGRGKKKPGLVRRWVCLSIGVPNSYPPPKKMEKRGPWGKVC